MIKEIDKILFDFIWENRTQYLKKNVLMNSYDKGGLNFLDFHSLNNTFKMNWLKQFFRIPTLFGMLSPLHMLSKICGISFDVGKFSLSFQHFITKPFCHGHLFKNTTFHHINILFGIIRTYYININFFFFIL
ncbi:hypothetical protein OJAV_G00166930, partial [Oryzias javanicus]